MVEHGHLDAAYYPVPVLWAESRIVVERIRWREANRAVTFQSAAFSVLSEKGGKAFKEYIDGLTNGE